MPVIEIRGLTRVYDLGDVQVHALRGIDLVVEKGEFVAIMGASGSGKSTLLNMVGCLDRPTAGTYLLDGEETSRLTRDQYADVRNRKIGFIFQGYNLVARTSALENVELPLLFAGVPTRQRRERSAAMLAKVGLADRMEHKPTELSGGQMQRVAIARALVNRPAIVLADEPTGNLDTTSGKGIVSLFSELHDAGQTIVIITHDHAVADLASRVVHIRDGEIVEDRAAAA